MKELLLEGDALFYMMLSRGELSLQRLGDAKSLQILQRGVKDFGADIDEHGEIHALTVTQNGALHYHRLGLHRTNALLAPPGEPAPHSPVLVCGAGAVYIYYNVCGKENHLVRYKSTPSGWQGETLEKGNVYLVYAEKNGGSYTAEESARGTVLLRHNGGSAFPLPGRPSFFFLMDGLPIFEQEGRIFSGNEMLFLGKMPATLPTKPSHLLFYAKETCFICEKNEKKFSLPRPYASAPTTPRMVLYAKKGENTRFVLSG